MESFAEINAHWYVAKKAKSQIPEAPPCSARRSQEAQCDATITFFMTRLLTSDWLQKSAFCFTNLQT